MTAESYHLKWDSHHCYLNSSVATLYKNEKYADVVLYSSSSTGCSANSNIAGISAHKLILSSCSQYFSAIFETSPITNNGVFYIVLPPDLSHRAIQILVQYMYVGEATVSNDILNEVLRGGEILKIRGLYRAASSNSANGPTTQHRPDATSDTAYNANSAKALSLNNGATSVRYLMEHQHQQQHIRNVANGASVMPKDCPVVIKSPKPLGLMNTTAHLTKSANNVGSVVGISINKKVAIDPDEKCCYNSETAPPPVIMREPSSICNEINCNNYNCSETPPQPKLQRLLLRRERSQSDEPTSLRRTPLSDRNMERSYTECIANNHMDRPDSFRGYEHNIRRSLLHSEQAETACDYSVSENYKCTASSQSKSLPETEILLIAASSSSLNNPCNFVNIKQEPSDWISPPSLGNNESNLQPTAMLHHHKVLDYQLNAIKTESSVASHEENRNSILPPEDYVRYFTCEICNKAFEDNSTLLQHFDTHSTTTSSCASNFSTTNPASSNADSSIIKAYVPKKRRRISDTNGGDYVNLQCDLCNTSFETAAEWVRHMNCQHTEIELAMFNNKKEKEQKHSNPENSIISNLKEITTITRQTTQRSSGMLSVSNLNTNCNATNSSVLCFSQQAQAESCQNENSADYMKSTLSPA